MTRGEIVLKVENDLTKGRPLQVILLFSLPLLLGNVFQQFYNVVDSVIVGHILGDKAFAAVGATSSIAGLVMGLAYGMTNGFSILIARYFGAKDYKKLRNAYASSLILTVVCSIVLTLVSTAGAMTLLKYLNTPEDVIRQSWQYIIIIFAGILITMSYNVLSGALRGIGNSKMPLVFLIISSLLNIVLDVLCIAGLHMGVSGAAAATLVAQLFSVVLCLWYLLKKCPILKVGREDFKLEASMLWELFSTGFSMGLMLSIVCIGSVAMQSSINGFGTNTVEAHSAARKIGEMFMVPLSTFSMAVSTFASQNFGAGKKERILDGIKCGIVLTFLWSAISIVAVYAAGRPMIVFLTGTKTQEVIRTALKYMHINLPFYFLLCILLILRWTLQGVGHKTVPLLASSVELVGKFIVVGWLAPAFGYFGVCICEPLIWGACAVIVTIDFVRWLRKEVGGSPELEKTP